MTTMASAIWFRFPRGRYRCDRCGNEINAREILFVEEKQKIDHLTTVAERIGLGSGVALIFAFNPPAPVSDLMPAAVGWLEYSLLWGAHFAAIPIFAAFFGWIGMGIGNLVASRLASKISFDYFYQHQALDARFSSRTNELKTAVERTHGCAATFAQTVCLPVPQPPDGVSIEAFDGQALLWGAVVHVFDLTAHPSAPRAYAWSWQIDGSTTPRFFAVLHQPPVDSPQAAVRAAIVAE